MARAGWKSPRSPCRRLREVVFLLGDRGNDCVARPVTRPFTVQLRGFEPRIEPAKIGSELRRMFSHIVTRLLRVLRICIAVLRDVTVLWPVLQPVPRTGRAR